MTSQNASDTILLGFEDTVGQPIRPTPELLALGDEYRRMWTEHHKSPPRGHHPIPSNVGQDDVVLYLIFTERVLA